MEFTAQADCRAAFAALMVLALALYQLAQLADLRRARALGGQADQRGLGQASGAEHLAGLLRVGRGQVRGMAGALYHHLLVGQAPEHPADHRAADAEGIAQGLLGQGAAGRQALFEDGIEQPG